MQVISCDVELKNYVTQILRESEAIKNVVKIHLWNSHQAQCLSSDKSARNSDSYNHYHGKIKHWFGVTTAQSKFNP